MQEYAFGSMFSLPVPAGRGFIAVKVAHGFLLFAPSLRISFKT